MNRIAALVEDLLPSITSLRHDLHACPEVGYEEHETSRRVLSELEKIPGLHIRSGVAKTGIVATLNADRPGRCVALRADLDALLITEATGLPYASRNPGRMHACGHDGHMSCLVGAAAVLSRLAPDLPGKVKFIFQPAEEGGGGGAAMCDAGVLDDPRVDAVFALHGWPDVDLGCVELSPGPTMASTDRWELTVHGVGAHAAFPHRGVDPIVVASHIVTALQTIVSRTIDPLDSAVVTVAKFHAGTAANIIPENAELEGTMRALNPEVRSKVRARIEEIATRTAAAFGATAEITFGRGYPVTMNDAACARLVADTAADVLGADRVSTQARPSMGAEDFSFFAERVPATYWRLGVGQGPIDQRPMLHQPTYNFPDAALQTGIRMHCEIVARFVKT
jgi:amidohydrolase